MQAVITHKDIPGASVEELAASTRRSKIALIVCTLRLVIRNTIMKIYSSIELLQMLLMLFGPVRQFLES
ncbi:MAG: hypothetical protein WBL68_00380 [Nitrososphaeraceae archaeon]